MDKLSRFRLDGPWRSWPAGRAAPACGCARRSPASARASRSWVVPKSACRRPAGRSRAAGSEALVLAADVTKEAEANRVIEETVQEFGRPCS